MKPFKTREGGAMDYGIGNEKKVLKRLNTFLENHSDYKILQLREYGLLAKRDNHFAATSPDAVCALRNREGGSVSLCVMEFKTRSAKTETQKLQQQVCDHGRFKECSAGSLEFKSLVPDCVGSRVQLHRFQHFRYG
jgi:hypothetical protein